MTTGSGAFLIIDKENPPALTNARQNRTFA